MSRGSRKDANKIWETKDQVQQDKLDMKAPGSRNRLQEGIWFSPIFMDKESTEKEKDC